MYIPSRCSTDVCMEVWVEGWEDRWMEVVVRGGEGTCVCTHDCAVFSRVNTEILGPATQPAPSTGGWIEKKNKKLIIKWRGIKTSRPQHR